MNVVEPLFRHAFTQPDAPAFITATRTLSYRDLMTRVQQLAAQLDAAGVKRGEIVATVAESLGPQLHLTLALAWLGAAAMPLDRRQAQTARDYGVKRLVHKLLAPGELSAPGVELISLESLRERGTLDAVPLVQCEPHETWRVSLSSGTTGRPKAIVFSHYAQMMKAQLLRTTFPGGDASERLMVYMGTELAFSYNYFMRTLQSGGAIVRAGSTAESALGEMRRHKVTMFVVSSGNAVGLVDEARKPGSPYASPPPSLKTVIVGGSQVGAGLHKALLQHLGANIYVGYGASEVGQIALQDTALQVRAPTSGGHVLPWIDLQAVDEDGKVLLTGQRGALRARSPGIATGYLYPEGVTPEEPPAFRDGWFYLDDHGFVTKDGLVFIGGRGKDVINIGGNKVEPTVIEEVIERDTAITESAVLAMDASSGHPVLIALVASAAPVDAAALRIRCSDALGAEKAPALVYQVDSLPRNQGGKVMRNALPALAVQAQRDSRA